MELSRFRLWLLRLMYLILVLGQVLTIWPGILFPAQRAADAHTVVSAFLAALSLLALFGLRYPVKMLPILLFELTWKAVWMCAFAIPAWLRGGLDDYATDVAFSVLLGLIITPIAIPWRLVAIQYWREPGEHFSLGGKPRLPDINH